MKKKTIGLIILLSTFYSTLSYSENHQTADKKNIEQQVWNTVKTINKHWAITENMDSLALFIHPDMTLFFPGGKLQGREQIIEAYRGNAAENETIRLEESEPVIQIYNNTTGIVTYYGLLTVKDSQERTHTFCFQDMYTLILENGQWYAVAQHYSFTNCPNEQ